VSAILKRSIEIAGHRTSITLEDEFWRALQEIAAERGMTLRALVAEIDADRAETNLSSAIRLAVLRRFRPGPPVRAEAERG
jgi:predicted DNA-binding ribbon-helix-helix protein